MFKRNIDLFIGIVCLFLSIVIQEFIETNSLLLRFAILSISALNIILIGRWIFFKGRKANLFILKVLGGGVLIFGFMFLLACVGSISHLSQI